MRGTDPNLSSDDSDPDSNPHANIHHEVLLNGLTLVLREARLAPVADVQVFAKVGSADEREGEGGLAHFHEHMLFKGTQRRGLGDIAGEVEGAGGRINAYTTFDVTVYYATMPSDSLAIGVDVLADAIQNSSFDADEVRSEREVVLERLRRMGVLSVDVPPKMVSSQLINQYLHVKRREMI